MSRVAVPHDVEARLAPHRPSTLRKRAAAEAEAVEKARWSRVEELMGDLRRAREARMRAEGQRVVGQLVPPRRVR